MKWYSSNDIFHATFIFTILLRVHVHVYVNDWESPPPLSLSPLSLPSLLLLLYILLSKKHLVWMSSDYILNNRLL